MAKSLRSKWRRKCKTIKRERYAVKELVRLKKMLGIEEDKKPSGDEIMEIVADQVITLDADALKKPTRKRKKVVNMDNLEPLSSDEEMVTVPAAKPNEKTRVYSTKTMRDQYGQYPVWLHRRKYAGGKKTKKGIRKTKRSKK